MKATDNILPVLEPFRTQVEASKAGIIETEALAKRQRVLEMMHDAVNLLNREDPDIVPVLSGLFDRGDKVPLIADSKAGKTWLVFHLIVALATGTRFLRWMPAVPQRVLYLQFELSESWAIKRLRKIAAALGVQPKPGWLKIMNLRGVPILEVLEVVKDVAGDFDCIIFDPLYKMIQGDESNSVDMKNTLFFLDEIARQGPAAVYVHHNPKGSAEQRKVIDRGAGSGVLGRDYDTGIYLGRHQKHDLMVLNTVQRNYPQQAGLSLRFDPETCLHLVVDQPAQERISEQPKKEVGEEILISVFKNGVLTRAEAVDALSDAGIGKKRGKETLDRFVRLGKLASWQRTASTGNPTGIKYYGRPKAIRKFAKKQER